MPTSNSQPRGKEIRDVNDYDLVLVTCSDLHGVGRGRYVFKSSVDGVIKHGLGMTQASLFCGIMCEVPDVLTEYKVEGWVNGILMPDLSTLKPISWLSYGGKKIGHLLCDLLEPQGNKEESIPRVVALRQLEALKTLGYELEASVDMEVSIFHKDTTTPVGLHEDISQLLNKLVVSLSDSDIKATAGMGFQPGALHISLVSQRGIEIADNVHRLRNALRSICVRQGYDVTFMTKPLAGIPGNRTSFSVTLIGKNGKNDFSSLNFLSPIGQQWAAGLLHHHGALTALTRPTLNCYTRDEGEAGLDSSLTVDEKNYSSRLVKVTTSNGPSIKDCLPSSASNPYIVVGALVAAGMDGINNKLDLNDQESIKSPNSLKEALVSLEEDNTMKTAMGSKFAQRFRVLKDAFEIRKLENNSAMEDSSHSLEFERSMYLQTL